MALSRGPHSLGPQEILDQFTRITQVAPNRWDVFTGGVWIRRVAYKGGRLMVVDGEHFKRGSVKYFAELIARLWELQHSEVD